MEWRRSKEIFEVLRPHRSELGKETLLNSKAAWRLLVEMYESAVPNGSFNDYFWTWRASLGGLYAALLGDLPPALVYHTIATGYAGLYACRAAIETGRPSLLTEHGIYTNERRIEIAMSDWLYEPPQEGLSIDQSRLDLKALWVRTFTSYSKACYEACDEIITLYEGNQVLQMQDGADASKLKVIPNGIDFERYSAVERDHDHPPTVALIGRVVPIKDCKTYIRACAILKKSVPNLKAYLFGPTEEDPEYFKDCEALVDFLELHGTFEFTGKVRLDDYLGRVDVIVLTSISEAQPLVILEAGAAGIPTVATNVGACSEMILGASSEDPPLGAGGAITALANPEECAQALAQLLTDKEWFEGCCRAIKERVRVHYNKSDLERTYRELYDNYRGRETRQREAPRAVAAS